MTAHDRMPTRSRAVKLTVEDFLLLDRSGAFGERKKTELLDGQVFVVNAQFSEHLTAKVTLLRRLADACDRLGGLSAWAEGSVDMSPHSMPEPDLFITNRRPITGAVASSTVVLIGEVADTTLQIDLGRKARLYAAAGVPEYWVVDLPGRSVHQLWSPGPKGYGDRRATPLGERLQSVVIPGLAIASDGI